jgi:hypothetical protein
MMRLAFRGRQAERPSPTVIATLRPGPFTLNVRRPLQGPAAEPNITERPALLIARKFGSLGCPPRHAPVADAVAKTTISATPSPLSSASGLRIKVRG